MQKQAKLYLQKKTPKKNFKNMKYIELSDTHL